MECQTWMIELEQSTLGGITVALSTCSNDRPTVVIQSGRYSDYDVLFQELMTLLDSCIWSFIATLQVAEGQPTLGGYEG